MSISAVTIAGLIADLTVTGVTLKDLDQIPLDVNERDCPMLYPKPNGFMSNLQVSRASLGQLGSGAKVDVAYTLTYVYLHKPIGAERKLFSVYPDMVTKSTAIIDAIIAAEALNDALITPQQTINYGIVMSPTGVDFFGCELQFRVTEYYENG